MLNPIASSEAIYSATYVDNYIDSVENLPDDVQRHLSRIRDIDVQYRGHLRDVDYYYDLWKSLSSTSENSVNRRARAIARMQSSLIHAQELGDEKMQIVNQLQELIDQKTRQLDSDQKNLDIKEEQNSSQQHVIRGGDDSIYGGTPQKISRSQSPNGGILLTSVIGIGTSSTSTGQMITGTGKESLCNAFSSALSGGMNQILNERSMVGSNAISAGGSSNGNNNYGNSNSNNMPSSNNSNTASGDGRSTSKRSRRQRNEIVSAMELGGNESNSANEGGSGERGCIVGLSGSGTLSQKQSGSNPSVSTAQKKTQQSGGVGGNVNTTNTGGASGTGGSAHTTKKKKRKARGGQATNTHSNTREDTPPVDPIDPDEPTYCLCDQISFGEMILCDNDLCPIEWFHFSCVSLVLKPKGKWYCPNCRGDRPNVMKPKAQFLKELERYNKEKEEKT